MKFFSMALRNIQKKSEIYGTYFMSTSFAVSIFFIFCSIYFNPAFESFHTGISKISLLFKGSAILVFLFSAVFVYYANSLFIRSRKREMAIFSLLGMRKIEIGAMLFCETLLVGIGAILFGLLIGSLFSRFFSMLLLRLMLGGAPGNHIEFRLAWQPYGVSILVFLLLFGVNALYSQQVIYRYELIDLLAAEKEGEKAPKFSVFSSILSVIFIGASYGIFLSFNGDQGAISLVKPAFGAALLMAVGTFLLFRNLVIWLLSSIKKKSFLYTLNRSRD